MGEREREQLFYKCKKEKEEEREKTQKKASNPN